MQSMALGTVRALWAWLGFMFGAAFVFVDRVLAFEDRAPSKTVAIVVPMADRAWLTADEEVSLRHLRHYLAPYDKFLIAPRRRRLRLDGMRTVEFSRKYFGFADAHNHLLYRLRFWLRFREYKYVLMYHLDALVFRDELLKWCETDVDYIGAPFLHCEDSPWVTRPRVGNGGFALMKVNSMIRVLCARWRRDPHKVWNDVFQRNRSCWKPLERVVKFFMAAGEAPRRDAGWHELARTETKDLHNDLFWSDHAAEYVNDFAVASFEEGLRFSFEVAPSRCYELNGRQLPFGCHAWTRYDRGFWEPYLLPDGATDGRHCEPPPTRQEECAEQR
jgi:hypothetical protein